MRNDMNDSRTNGHESTEGVPSWPATRAAMIKHREIVKADSPKGRAISNLIEMGDNAETYVRPSWATDRRQTLPYFMERAAARLGAV